MKRFISWLLACVLTLTLCMPVRAGMALENDPNASMSAEPEEEIAGVSAAGAQVNVTITSGLVLRGDAEFQVSIEESGMPQKAVTLPGEPEETQTESRAQRGEAVFEGLGTGTYTVKVTAPGFADYTQVIEIDTDNRNKVYSLELVTGEMAYVGNAHPGILQIGDVDRSGAIDEADRNLLVDAIDRQDSLEESGDLSLDLNLDGKVNLADLEYFAKGWKLQDQEDTLSTVKISVPPSAVTVSANQADTICTGDLESLLKNEGTVQLARPEDGKITKDSPVSVELNFTENNEDYKAGGMVIESVRENGVTEAEIEIVYTDADGNEQRHSVSFQEDVQYLLRDSTVDVRSDASGAILVNFGSQIAVKRVILKITGTRSSNNLVEISKVEFVNDMESRIPEPALDIPQNVQVTQVGSQNFSLKWEPCVNVTGYEVLIENDGQQEIKPVTGNILAVTGVAWGPKGKLKNGETYKASVRSVNGTWRSSYSNSVEATPKPEKRPDPPDYVAAVGQYKAINVSWKDMEDTDSYNLFYREDTESEYEKIEGIETNSYTLSNLKDKTAYVVYVTGVNEIGESGPSREAKAETVDISAAEMRRYKLINAAGADEVSEHIISATTNGTMVDSPLDTETGTAWGAVDNNPKSQYYIGSWDGGGFNNLGNHGITVEFDQEYKIQDIAVQGGDYFYAQVRYWDENGTAEAFRHGQISVRSLSDSEGRKYYLIHLPKPVNAKKIQFGLARYSASGTITVSEVYYYHYDSLEDDIMALYTDDLHTVLREDVNQGTIDALRERINTVDEASGEYHPDRVRLERELKTAEDILKAGMLSDSVEIHNGITTSDAALGFGGLNAWQPLGVTAAAEEEITVYVGHNTKRTGDNTNLQLVATQFYANASTVAKAVANLKIGRNDIKIPRISTENKEAGGALYVQYTGNSANDRYAVRVNGGVEIPVLDLYQVTDGAQRQERAVEYIKKLDAYIAQIEKTHEEVHKSSENKLVNCYEYSPQRCILGAADILLDTMMLSIPAQQIQAGSGSGTEEERAAKIVQSMDAMEEMMHLFYQHKGLNKTDSTVTEAVKKFPARHLNIRYQSMFAGAFMYASGNHIGIEYPETRGMVTAAPVQKDANGKWESGQYFGWGIAHEIGHCINQGSYAVAEITNNYFSVLAQARDANGSVRFQYKNVYEKVTSGTKGPASNVFTQLGMYWQLHLAYDNGYNYKIYEKYDQQLANLFFARVDTYSRTPASAPKPGGIELKTGGDKDQTLMRLSCAAAEKNILDFFERWGKTPDEETKAYAGQFEKESRAIYYANDDSRVYRLTHGGSSLSANAVEAVGEATSASVNAANANQVDFNLTASDAIPAEDILGYEIVRCMTSGGQVERQTVGFATADDSGNATFSDHVTTVNNRVVTYEVTLIDHYLNRSKVKKMPSLKIQHDGSIDKANWTVSANGLKSEQAGEVLGEEEGEHTCGEQVKDPITKVADNDSGTAYEGTVEQNGEILLEFNQEFTVTAFKYTPGASSAAPVAYTIYARDDAKGEWVQKAEGTFAAEGIQTVYFAGEGIASGNIAASRTTAVKMAVKNEAGTKISIGELDVLGVTSDNVEFRHTESQTPSIGRLSADYKYGTEAKDVIPKGSIVFIGSYKGNSAYNVVLLYDQDGNNVGGLGADGSLNAVQIVMADVPEKGEIQDSYDGTWVYWIEPDSENQLPNLTDVKQVRAELYRVDDALTNKGQRLVSDSLFENMPEELPEINIERGSSNQQ